LGGFTGPYLVGYLKQATDSYQVALLLLSFCILCSAGLVTLAGRMIAARRAAYA
jgi:cyanate permease